jgi:hypothetical protein
MKTFLLSTLAVAVTATTFAQDATPAPAAPSSVPPVAAPQQQRLISPEEASELKAVSQKAQQDPAVQAAIAKRQKAMMDASGAMISRNPSIAPLVQKALASGTAGATHVALTQDERMQLHTALNSLQGTPEGDALQSTTKEYIAALTKAMITADPGIVHILAKLPIMNHRPVTTGSAAPAVPGAASSSGAAPQQ